MSATAATPSTSVRVIGEMPELREVDRGEYERRDDLGQGGWGRVVNAVDRRLRRPVALKELLDGADEDSKKRFVTEALITARLQHPSIVPVYELGCWPNGEQFYTMRPIAGRSLDKEIHARPTLAQRLPLLGHVIAAADALAYAHSQGIIHRDIKPANILVGDFGETVIIDWGTAKDLTRSAAVVSDPAEPSGNQRCDLDAVHLDTIDGSVMGTPAYMSPEHACKLPVDERTDVYSLGAVLYHLLAGKAPYDGCSIVETIKQVQKGELPPVERLEPSVPVELRAILQHATHRLAHERYRNAKEFADDLKRYQDGQLVAAYKYTPLDFLRHWMRTRRRIMLSTLLTIIAIAGAGIVSLYSELSKGDAAVRLNITLLDNQARGTLHDDPTASVALLKRLLEVLNDARSSRVFTAAQRTAIQSKTHEVALDALSRGVARHVFRPGIGLRKTSGFSPDSTRYAWAGESGDTVIRDTHSGQVLYRWPGNPFLLLFSPDGQTLAEVAQSDSTITLRNYRQQTSRKLTVPAGNVTFLTYSRDGAYLLATYANYMVRLWNVATGTHREFSGCEGSWGAARFSPDGRRFVYAGDADHRHAIYLRAVKEEDDRATSPQILRGHTDIVRTLSFSPDGRFLVSGGQDRTCRHWDLSTGQSRTLYSSQEAISNALYASTGDRVAISDEHTVQIWDRQSGVLQSLGIFSPPIWDLALSPDGHLLAWGTESTVMVRDLDTGNDLTLRGHDALILQVQFSPDNKQLASADTNGTARLWAIPAERQRVLRNAFEGPPRFVMSPDGRFLATLGAKQTVQLWDTQTGRPRTIGTEGRQAERLAFAPDSEHLAIANTDGSVLLSQLSDNRFIKKTGNPGPAQAVAFSPDGAWVAASGSDSDVHLWSVAGNATRTFVGPCAALKELAFSPDGRWLAAPCTNGTGRLWNVKTGHGHELRGHQQQLSRLSFSHDSRWLATTGADGSVWLWDVATATGTRVGQHETQPAQANFSPDDRYLVYGVGNVVYLRDQKTNSLIKLIKYNTGQVSNVVFSLDGAFLAVGDWNGTIHLWSVSSHTTLSLFRHQNVGAIYGLTFSPAGTLISSSYDQTLRIWHTSIQQTIGKELDTLSSWLSQLTTALIENNDQIGSP